MVSVEESEGRRGLFPAGLAFHSMAQNYEELCEFAAFWQLETCQLQPGRYSAEMWVAHTAGLQMSIVKHGCGTRVSGAIPKGTVVLSWALATSGAMQFRGMPISRRDVMLQEDGEGLDFSFSGRADIVTLAMSRDDLNRFAANSWQADPEKHLKGRISFSGEGEAAAMGGRIGRVLRRISGNARSLSAAGCGERVEREILDALFRAIPEPLPPVPGVARRWYARRAASLLRERCMEDISIGELCEVLGASRRTLHLGFMELYGVPPMRYLQAFRLNGVRAQLKGGRRDWGSVTEIATAWGFGNMGRFSAAYRRFFGVLPSQDR